MREYKIKDLVDRIKAEQQILDNNKSDDSNVTFTYKLNFSQKKIILYGNIETI